MDPALTSDGQPYGPERFETLIEERYLISKYTHTSYLDVGKITPREREKILQLIIDDMKREQELRDKAVAN